MDLFNDIAGNFEFTIPIGKDTIEGSAENDNLSAGSGNNTLNGKDGDDTLTAGSGSNSLSGDAGNDNLSAGSGNNTLTGSAGNDILNAGSGNNQLDGGAGNDILNAGSGNNILTGSLGNDTLTVGSGNNQLDGGADDDYLVGSTFSNTLTGGAGADTFFLTKPKSDDSSVVIVGGEVHSGDGENTVGTITDFKASEGDKIQIEADSFGVAPGDTSMLMFDNNTNVLSIGEEQVIKVSSGAESEILANTEVVEDSVISIGADGGDGEDATNGEIGADGADAVNEDNGTSAADDDPYTNVFRFFETQQGFHFYTSSESEKNAVLQQIEDGELSYNYEGESFTALTADDDGDPLTGAKPVYRLFNNVTGAHLYTISPDEKDSIINNLPDYSLEGVAYYAYDIPQENAIPLYRLYNSDTGTHFFTPSAAEKEDILNTLPQYREEGNDGIAFHVLSLELS